MVLFEDSAAIVGILIAAGATALSVTVGAPWIDGAGSILIGALLAVVAVILARESKALLIGERASPEIGKTIRRVASEEPCVVQVVESATSQLAPDRVIANVAMNFSGDLRVQDLEKVITRIETAVTHEHPELFRMFIRPHAGA
jgi:divalent metal cation (Fe/Co/Zn/Cd) transporter